MPTLEAKKEVYNFVNFKSERQKKLFETINNAIKNNIQLFSFDIFDTLITRTTVTPSGIFSLIQQELTQNPKYNHIDNDFKNNFYFIRKGAEHYLDRTRISNQRKTHIPESEIQQEISIEEIYETIKYHHNLDMQSISKMIQLEIETECKNSLPLKENIELLKYLISKGKNVILISDMYLKENAIRNLLLKHDEIFKDIKIYVSSELKARKTNGNLYKAVKNIEKIEYKNWLHIGDNMKSDIIQAQKVSINTYHIEKEELTEFEKNIFDSKESNPYYQTIIGNARNIRRFYPDNKKADFGTIATIMLFPYVKWIINQSLKKGLKRLYFIARDGYILKKIADTIIKQENINIETHYIYGSREAWRMPCVESFEDLWFTTTIHKKTATIKQLAKIFNITTDELKRFLPKYYQNKTTPMTIDAYLPVFNILQSNPEFLEFIINKNKTQSELLDKYLKQEIDLKDDKYAFVDLTCSGISIDLIARKIFKISNHKTNVFSFRLSSRYDFTYCNIFSFHQIFLSSSIEYFGRAPHGQTTGYKEENGRIIPILAQNEKIDNFNDYSFIIEKFAKLYNDTLNVNNLSNSNIIVHDYHKNILENPTLEIANYYSNIPFNELGTNKKHTKKITISDLIDFYIKKEKALYIPVFNMQVMASPIYIRLLAKVLSYTPKINNKFFKKLRLIYKAINMELWR